MQIYNPTKEKIEVQIKGTHYEIEPEDSIYNVPEEDARDWQEKTHKFIQLRKDKVEDIKDQVIEVPTPKVQETVLTPSVQDQEITTDVSNTLPDTTVSDTVEDTVVAPKPRGRSKAK